MTSPSVSSSIADGGTLQGAVVINDGLLDDSNDSDSCEGKRGNQENGGGDGGKESLKRGEIDGVFCPICFEAWTSGGEHQMCCLPCGHIFGLSCIKKCLQRDQSSQKCPQCKGTCTLNDVRVLYATRLCFADEELRKRVRSLILKCANLEHMVHIQQLIRQKDTARIAANMKELEGHRVEQQRIKALQLRLEKLSAHHQLLNERRQKLLDKFRGDHQKDLEYQAREKRMLDNAYIGMRAHAYMNEYYRYQEWQRLVMFHHDYARANPGAPELFVAPTPVYYPYEVDGAGSMSQSPPQPIPQEYVDFYSHHNLSKGSHPSFCFFKHM